MSTARGARTAMGRLIAGSTLALLGLTAGCELDPEVRVQLQASKSRIGPGESVQITATVTEDGDPVEGEQVQFSATPVGDFTSGSTATTDVLGQAAAVYRVESEELSDDTLVEISATAVTSGKVGTLELEVVVNPR